MLIGCGDKEVTHGNGDEPKSYTTQFECVRSDNTSKYMIEKKYGKRLAKQLAGGIALATGAAIVGSYYYNNK